MNAAGRSDEARDRFREEVASRFGVLPNFFCTAEPAPGLIEELWGYAKAAYLDSPLPALFKERLFVHLSRFCAIRYCIVRHVGFLIGRGCPAGDAQAGHATIDEVIALLRRPIPDADALGAALERLRSGSEADALPEPGTQAEDDLFWALSVIFLEPVGSERARETVRVAFGDRYFELLAAYLAFIRTAHYWTETHPELAYEPDMLEAMERRPDLASLVLDPSDAEQVRAGRPLRDVLEELKRTEAALCASESRFRAFVTASSDAVYRMSPDWSEMHQLDGHGILADTSEPTPGWMETYIDPNDRAMVSDAIARAIRTKSKFELEHRVRHADGTIGWTLSRAVPILEENGGITEWLGAASDVTGRRNAEAALRDSEERFRSFAEHSADTVWIVNAETRRLEYLSPAFERMWGEPRENVLADLGRWQELVHPDDRAAASEALPRALAGETFVAEYRVVRSSDGAVVHIRDTGFPMRDAAGRLRRIGGVAQDVSEERRSEEHQATLLAELQHRVRNTLAVIRSIARRSAASSETVEDYAMELDGRLNAFARVQAAVTRNPLAGIDLEYLIADELHVHTARDDRQVQIGGPPVRLQPKAAETLGLAVHELTTNAVKHGALATSFGRVSVSWKCQENGYSDPRLFLIWKESGVDPAVFEPARRGFGMDLLIKTLAYELKANTKHLIEPDGLRYTVDLPLSDKIIANGAASSSPASL